MALSAAKPKPEQGTGWMNRIVIWTVAVCVTVAFAVAVVRFPLASVLAITVPLAPFIARRAGEIAVTLLLAGPLLGSTIKLGPLTLDNWLVIAGLGVLGVWLIPLSARPIPRLSMFPLLLAVAIGVSGVVNEVDFFTAAVRYIGIAAIPIVVLHPRGVSFRTAERILLSCVTLGLLSVVLQPVMTALIPAYVDPTLGAERYGGLFGHPNFAACVLALTALHILARPRASAGMIVWLVIAAYAILSTGSVGALAALFAGLLIVVLRSVETVIGAVVVSLAALALFGATLFARLDELTSSSTPDNSFVWRYYQWQAALRLPHDPNLFGIGWQQVERLLTNGLPAHSAYVAIYVELGVVGALLSLLGIAIMFRAAERSRETLALFAFVAISSVSDPIAFYPSTLAVVITMLAIRIKSSQSLRADEKQVPRSCVLGSQESNSTLAV